MGHCHICKDTQSLVTLSKKGADVGTAIGTALCRVPLSQLHLAVPSVGSAEASPIAAAVATTEAALGQVGGQSGPIMSPPQASSLKHVAPQ